MWRISFLGFLALINCSNAWPNLYNKATCEEAQRCDQAACDALGPEKCHCSGNETSIKLEDRPQVHDTALDYQSNKFSDCLFDLQRCFYCDC